MLLVLRDSQLLWVAVDGSGNGQSAYLLSAGQRDSQPIYFLLCLLTSPLDSSDMCLGGLTWLGAVLFA